MRIWWSRIVLLPIPLTILVWALNHLPPLQGTLTRWIFALGVLSMVPLAARIAAAGDVLTTHLGERVGGLLDVTFDDIPELTIGIGLLIQAGLHASNALSVTTHLEIVRSLLLGTILNNLLFTLGVAILPAALRHGRLRFRTSTAKHFFAILGLALVGLGLPTLAVATMTTSGPQPSSLSVALSVSFSVILLICYVAYLAFSIFRFRVAPVHPVHPVHGVAAAAGREGLGAGAANTAEQAERTGRDTLGEMEERERQEELEDEQEAIEEQQQAQLRRGHPHAVRRALAGLGLATLTTAAIAGILVSVTDTVIQQTPLLTPLSVGFIIFPFVCNLGVQASAIEEAWRNKMHDALAIAAGSAVQVALFVTPLLVLLSVLLAGIWTAGGEGGAIGNAAASALILTLVFPPAQVILLGVAVLVFASVTLHARSAWFDGLQLLVIYFLIALVVFALPGH